MHSTRSQSTSARRLKRRAWLQPTLHHHYRPLQLLQQQQHLRQSDPATLKHHRCLSFNPRPRPLSMAFYRLSRMLPPHHHHASQIKREKCSLPPPRRRRLTRHQSSLLSLIILLFAPSLTQAQQTTTLPYYAGSAIVDNTLYLLGGTASSTAPFEPSSHIYAISLVKSFDTNSFTLQTLGELEFTIPFAHAAPFKDSPRILVTGNFSKQIASIYDVTSRTWSTPTSYSNNVPLSDRSFVGVALDQSTGFHVLYGGTQTQTSAAVGELDILQPGQNTGWIYAKAMSRLPPLLQPIVIYVPSLRQTLIMGGCGSDSVECFKSIYLVQTSQESIAPEVSDRTIAAPYPSLRSAACTALVDDNTVLVYGGTSMNKTLSDVWALNVNSWTWSEVKLHNLPAEGREGATCVKGAGKQVIVAGGFMASQNNSRLYASPQLAVIDMDTMTWTTQYNASKGTSTLSTPIWIGIAAAGAALLISGILGIYFWRRRQRAYALANTSAMEISTLSSSSSPTPSDGQASFAKKPPLDTSLKPLKPSAGNKSHERLPLIITPYRPTPSAKEKFTDIDLDRSMNDSRIEVGTTFGSPYLGNGLSSYGMTQSSSNFYPAPSQVISITTSTSTNSSKTNSTKTIFTSVAAANWGAPSVTSALTRPRAKATYSYNRDSERLDSVARDAQHQAYAKQQMLAELSRSFPPTKDTSTLKRSETVYTHAPTNPEDPDAELVSTLLNLRPIELGEESGSKASSQARHVVADSSGIGGPGRGYADGRITDATAGGAVSAAPEYGMTAMLVSGYMGTLEEEDQMAESNESIPPSALDDPRLDHLNGSKASSQASLIRHDYP